MGNIQGSYDDPERKRKTAHNHKTRLNAHASSKLSFFLPEAMVNHKKMVHPPS